MNSKRPFDFGDLFKFPPEDNDASHGRHEAPQGPQQPGQGSFGGFGGVGGFGGFGRGGDKQPRRKRGFKKPGPLGWTIIIVAAIVAFILICASIWTEILWYVQLGFQRVLFTRWIAVAVLFILGLLLISILIMINMRLAYNRRPDVTDVPKSVQAYRNMVNDHKKVLGIVIPLALGVLAGINLSARWQDFMTMVYGTSFGQKDAQFGIDIGFFVFKLPMIATLVDYFIGGLVIATVLTVIVYYVYGAVRLQPRLSFSRPARIHTGILLAITSLAIGVHYILVRYQLVYQQGTPTDGAMYTDVHAVLPAQTILAAIAALIALLFVYSAFKGSWHLPVAGIAVMVVSALVIGTGYPLLIQRFKVKPNERNLEAAYIDRNIKATFAAYGMEDMEYKTYNAKTDTKPGQLRNDADSTSQIRLLDPEVIAPTVRQMEQSRPYYGFPDQFSVDRYTLNNKKRDTVIAVREINQNGLSPSQRNWVNDHTVYTHGFGVVAAFGNNVEGDGLPKYWESSIPSKGEMGTYEPRVYFSKNSPEYSIVGAPKGAAPQELDYPDDQKKAGQVNNTFKGNGGPSVGNLWNKLLYSIRFQSFDLLFSTQVNSESQILYDRDPALRVSKVAPYLTLDKKVYPAVVDMDGDPKTPKRLVWIVDAFTTSANYPYAQHINLRDAIADSRTNENTDFYAPTNTVNYMRNSVKAVVDAYDGSVKLFEWDKNDPVLKTWKKIYPGQVSPMKEISGDLMAHLRYPEDLFKVQRELLTNYHVTEARQFYTGGDQWKLSEDPSADASVNGVRKLQPPYYLTMKMPSQESAEFSLTSVFIPGGEAKRAAMAGFMAVDSETGSEPGKVRDGYGKLRVIALPSSTTVPGPGQVQNNFNSNNRVNKELNLQDQQGSKVIRGNLLTLPVGGGLLYVQPVYIQSTGTTSYPQLRSVLVAFGDKIGFAPTLEEALDQVFGGDSAATTADTKEKAESRGTPTDAKAKADSTPKAGSSGDGTELGAALNEAKKAMDDADAAMRAGDWAAYGRAQDALDAALEKAIAIQNK